MKGAICGGVISLSQLKQDIKKYGAYADMMAFVMPDKYYKKYIIYLKQGKRKEANRLFKKYSQSQI